MIGYLKGIDLWAGIRRNGTRMHVRKGGESWEPPDFKVETSKHTHFLKEILKQRPSENIKDKGY